nr:MAG TPA: hypothetical protein [Caudoviricetes sp.]
MEKNLESKIRFTSLNFQRIIIVMKILLSRLRK